MIINFHAMFFNYMKISWVQFRAENRISTVFCTARNAIKTRMTTQYFFNVITQNLLLKKLEGLISK